MDDRDRECQLELQDGAIVATGPSDRVASEVGVRLSSALSVWVIARQSGWVFDASGGFILPNQDLCCPDGSCVAHQRLPRLIRDFAKVAPHWMVEIKSQSDRVAKLREKLTMHLNQGAEVALLVDPDRRAMAPNF